MEHKFLRLYIDGVWHGHPERLIKVNGVEHDLDEYAKAHGIELPDAKKTKKQVNSYADMDKQDDSGDTEES
jgi:hypothetical protein